MLNNINNLMDKLFEIDSDEYIKIQEATSRIEEMDCDEWDEIYDSASELGKQILDEYSYDFADSAIGDTSWRCGTDFED